jgi:hypothetical protein
VQRLRVISLAFFLEGSISETPHRRTQIPERVVPSPETFGKRVLKNLSLKVEGLLLRCHFSMMPESAPLLHSPLAHYRESCGMVTEILLGSVR